MAHETDARTGTSTGSKSHIYHLSNHPNMTKAMVSLMAASESRNKKHATVIYMPNSNMTLKYYKNYMYATYFMCT